jgi:hypothetical protein
MIGAPAQPSNRKRGHKPVELFIAQLDADAIEVHHLHSPVTISSYRSQRTSLIPVSMCIAAAVVEDQCRGECLAPLAAVANPRPIYTLPET